MSNIRNTSKHFNSINQLFSEVWFIFILLCIESHAYCLQYQCTEYAIVHLRPENG